MKSTQVPAPSLATQKNTVSVLSAFDDLIENNKRRIEILEEMARTIYREWFVHFRYPGHEDNDMVDSELGEIPEGWEVRQVEDVVDRLSRPRKYKQTEVEEDGEVPVIDQSTDYLMGYHSNSPDYKATPEAPIIIFGDHTCKHMLLVEPFSIGANVIPFVSQDNLPVPFLYHLTKAVIDSQEYKRHWTDFKKKTIVVPPKELTVRFSEYVKRMHQEIRQIRKVNKNLRKSRDLLLPRLISGEIDVKGLDISIPEAETTEDGNIMAERGER